MTSGSPSSAPIPDWSARTPGPPSGGGTQRLRGRGEPGPAGAYWAGLGVNGIRYGGDRIPPFFPQGGLRSPSRLLWASEFHRRACAAQPPGAARADIRSGVRAGQSDGMSDPPSSARRAPKRTKQGCDAIFPATKTSPWRKAVTRSSRLEGTKEKTSPTKARSASEFMRIQKEVVALCEHVLVHLLRPLGRDEQVEPELPALSGDPGRVLGRKRGDGILKGARGPDVVGLVDHDEDWLAIGAAPPQRREDRLGKNACSSRVEERAEVDDQAAGLTALDVVDERLRPSARQSSHCSMPRFLTRRREAPSREGFRGRQLVQCHAVLAEQASTSANSSPVGDPDRARARPRGRSARAGRSGAGGRSRHVARRCPSQPRHRRPRTARPRPRGHRRGGRSRVRVENDEAEPVSTRSRSSTSPSSTSFQADCPPRNVWRSNPPASSAAGTPGASRRS